MSKKEKEESYSLTLKGLIYLATNQNMGLTIGVLDALELYLRRFHSEGGTPAVALVDGDFKFVTITEA